VLIGNPDRHDENLRTDDRLAPKRIVVYDHDVALLGALPPGTDRLAELGAMLGIAGETPTSTVHCLLPALTTAEYFGEWLERIADTPAWFIKDTCEDSSRKTFGFARRRKCRGKVLDRPKRQLVSHPGPPPR